MTWHSLGRAAFAGLLIITAAAAHTQVASRISWRFEIPSNSPGAFIGVGADGSIYATDFIPGDLYALSPNGTLLWTLPGAGGGNPISFAADGTIYTGEVSIFAVNPNGTVRWEFVSPATGFTNRLLTGPNVGPDGNIYAAENVLSGLGLGFFSLDPNGKLRWFNQGEPNASGLTDGDEIVFGNSRIFGAVHFLRSGPWHTSYCFNHKGSQLWFAGFLPRYLEPTSPPRMLPSGHLVYRAGSGSLAAVNQDGFADWIVPHPDGAQKLVTPVVGSDGSIYTGDAFGVQLWSANSDGTTRWVLGGDVYDSLACLGVSPDNRVVVVGGSSYYGGGWIRGFAASNGELLWQLDLAPELGLTQIVRSVRPAFSADGNTAYLTTHFAGSAVGHGYLYAINLGEVAGPKLSRLTLNPTSVQGGSSATGTVSLAEPATEYTVVTLSSNSVSAAVPGTVAIPAGSSQATFMVSTYPVTSNTSVTISASRLGQTVTARLRITRS